LLDVILAALRNIDERLAKLESGNIIFDERRVIAGKGEFEGKTYTTLPSGGIVKEIKVCYCDDCGRKSEEYNVCTACGKKLCNDCSVTYRGRIICYDCARKEIPLDREDYEVLNLIAMGFQNAKEISEILMMNKDEVIERWLELLNLGLIEKKGFSIYSRFELTAAGREALNIFSQIYGRW
jgi:hypothetical protein